MSAGKVPPSDPLERRLRQELAARAHTVLDLDAVGAPLDAMVEATENGLKLVRMARSPTGAGLRSALTRMAQDDDESGDA